MDACIERICDFPWFIKDLNQSTVEAFRSSDYMKYYRDIPLEALQRKVMNEEAIVDRWLGYSGQTLYPCVGIG